MKRAKWFYHPVFVFSLSTVALGISLFLYIYWYVKASKRLDALVRKFNIAPEHVLKAESWVVILVLSILVVIILVGIFTIFIYAQKTLQLYRLQHNFINNFTHELKTPVTSLTLYLETFLKHDIQKENQDRYIRYMLQDVERLSDNIDRILNLARIESKSYTGEFMPRDIAQMVTRFFENYRHLFQNSDIQVHAPSTAPFVYPVNQPLFEMLLTNLVSNAIKYNLSDTPRIDISFGQQKGYWTVRFADNGIGIEKGEIRKIFRKFYQIGRSDNMTAKGSGLGLYLVQNIARLHRGKVVAQSDGPGRGTVFSLLLPIKKQCRESAEIESGVMETGR